MPRSLSSSTPTTTFVEFTLPELRGACRWALEIDTNISEPGEGAVFASGEVYGVTGRSLLLFSRQDM